MEYRDTSPDQKAQYWVTFTTHCLGNRWNSCITSQICLQRSYCKSEIVKRSSLGGNKEVTCVYFLQKADQTLTPLFSPKVEKHLRSR